MPTPEQLTEACQRLRALLARTNPGCPAHRELVEVVELIDEELKKKLAV